jgi:DNA polymerase-3 subunit alpha
MAAVLSSDMDNTDKVVGFLDEARALGLTVLPPDANASDYMFRAVDARTIRYGLGAIKGVGRGACESIVEERGRGGEFPDLLDFCRRVDANRLNRRVLEALVHAGALDALAANRATLMLQLPEALKAADQIARNREAGIVDMFGNPASGAADIAVELPECAEWPASRLLQGERDALGHYLSGHPLDAHREELLALVGHDLGGLEALWERGAQPSRPQEGRSWRQDVPAVVAGLVVATRRKGDGQVFVLLDDGRGKIECAFFNEAASEFAPLLVRDRILLVEGGLREDEFNGGFSLRARRAWDFHKLCESASQQLALSVDARVPGTMAGVEDILARHRPGATPLRYQLKVEGAEGRIDLNGSQGVRGDAELPPLLRALPGVRAVRLLVARPWAQG